MIRFTRQARKRRAATSRIAAGILGAYGLTSLATVALSLLLARTGLDRMEAVAGATLVSFAIFAVIAMSVFNARSAVRAWGWLLACGLPLVLVISCMLPGASE